MGLRIEIECREEDIKIPDQHELLTIECDGWLLLDCKLLELPLAVSPGVVRLVFIPSLARLVPSRIPSNTHDEWRVLNE